MTAPEPDPRDSGSTPPDPTKGLSVISRLSLTLAVAMLAAVGLAACGSSSSSTSSTTASSTTSSSTTPAAGGGGGGGASSTVNIAADPSGQLAYQQTSATAKAGDVSVDFTNDASLTHDVCLQSSSGEQLGCTDQISGSNTSHDFGTLKPGTYTFYCSVDSHEQAGMKGTLTVK
jgi:plastocyanin